MAFTGFNKDQVLSALAARGSASEGADVGAVESAVQRELIKKRLFDVLLGSKYSLFGRPVSESLQRSLGGSREGIEDLSQYLTGYPKRDWLMANLALALMGMMPHGTPMMKQITEASPDEFIKIRERSSRPQWLYPYTAEELSEMRLYRVSGQDAGYAIKADGDLVNLSNSSKVPGLGKVLVEDAIKNGAKKLDCYDGFLVDYYKKFGFKEVARDPWNDEFKPPGWNYDEYGTPDVVYMELSE